MVTIKQEYTAYHNYLSKGKSLYKGEEVANRPHRPVKLPSNEALQKIIDFTEKKLTYPENKTELQTLNHDIEAALTKQAKRQKSLTTGFIGFLVKHLRPSLLEMENKKHQALITLNNLVIRKISEKKADKPLNAPEEKKPEAIPEKPINGPDKPVIKLPPMGGAPPPPPGGLPPMGGPPPPPPPPGAGTTGPGAPPPPMGGPPPPPPPIGTGLAPVIKKVVKFEGEPDAPKFEATKDLKKETAQAEIAEIRAFVENLEKAIQPVKDKLEEKERLTSAKAELQEQAETTADKLANIAQMLLALRDHEKRNEILYLTLAGQSVPFYPKQKWNAIPQDQRPSSKLQIEVAINHLEEIKETLQDTLKRDKEAVKSNAEKLNLVAAYKNAGKGLDELTKLLTDKNELMRKWNLGIQRREEILSDTVKEKPLAAKATPKTEAFEGQEDIENLPPFVQAALKQDAFFEDLRLE